MKTNQEWISALRESATFHEYQKAFTETTNLPLSLQAAETWNPALRGSPRENEFCKLMAGQSRTCAACLQLQERLCNAAGAGTQTRVCPYGLTEVAVPVSVGEKTIGFLRTGQVFTRPITEEDTDRVCERVKASGYTQDLEAVRKLYSQTKIRSHRQISSIAKLLGFFADHLAMKSNLLAIQESSTEPSTVTRVREFVKAHYGEDITLLDAAKAAHTSVYYLCKLLRKHLGMTFTELLCRERIEQAKSLLAKPNRRVSEIAYEVGFQSLTHFNRTFKKLIGESPTDFRIALSHGLAA